MAIEKIKIVGAVLELPAKLHCQSSPFTSEFGPNGLNWQCCLAGSSKTAPRILIFSIAIGANYSYEVKNSEIWAPAFFKHNNSSIATVSRKWGVPIPQHIIQRDMIAYGCILGLVQSCMQHFLRYFPP